MMKRFLLLTVLLTGCTSYRHERFDVTTGKPVELTTFRAPFLTKQAVEGLKTRVTDKHGTNSYSRSFGLTSGENSGDAEAINAVGNIVGAAVSAAVKAAAHP